MDLVRMEERDGVTVVTMQDGKANTLSRTMVTDLAQAADRLTQGTGPIVLTGSGRFFSAGLDLAEVMAVDRPTLSAFVDLFEKMCISWFTLGRPVVAAVNGHAIAGGTVMALTADRILGARGEYRMGLTELPLGISLPAVVQELVHTHLAPGAAGRVILEGETFLPDDCLALGLLHRIVEPDALFAEGCGLAKKLASSPGHAFRNAKHDLRKDRRERMVARRFDGREQFLASIFDPSVRAHIQATLDAMKAKKK